MASTPNGFDPTWIKAINDALIDRGSKRQISDLNDDIWARFFGPMIDALEDGEYDDLD